MQQLMKNMGKTVPTSLPSPPPPTQFPLTPFSSSLFTPANLSTPQNPSASIHPAFKSPSNETALVNEEPAALDLSNAAPMSKRVKLSPDHLMPHRSQCSTSPPSHSNPVPDQNTTSSPNNSSPSMKTSSFFMSNVSGSSAGKMKCRAADREEVNAWTVEQVCDFVRSIDICAEYVEVSGSHHVSYLSLSIYILSNTTITQKMKEYFQ